MRENEIEQSKPLEKQDGERLDIGTTGGTSGAEPHLATEKAVNGTEGARREGANIA